MAISSVHSSSSSKFKKMSSLAANKKVFKKRSPTPKKSKGLVQAKGEGSRRKYGSVDENSIAMRRARELQANLSPEFPSLVKFMLRSHTTVGFWLSLQKDFCTSHLPNHDAAITLVDENGRETKVKYLVEKHGLSGGWRGFSLEHNLVAGDVLVFQLIEPSKIKVYIVRENDSTNIAGAINLLGLSHSAQPIASEVFLQEGDDAEDPQREVSTSDHCPESNLTGNDSDNSPQPSMNVEFSQVKSFEGFNVVVNSLNIDSEISEGDRRKYYELCCSREAYLHQELEPGLNYTLIAGAITEMVGIADGIKAAKLTTTGRDVLEVWDRTLKGLGEFGMQVGFLRERIRKLVRLCEVADNVAIKKKEKERAEAEMKDLESKMGRVREVINNLDAEIQACSSKEKVEELFKDVASAAW